ncbi:hypothetical protein K438DRAFT_1989296 [Mycena galopus ATCC 62051]|nr:hypothetical protein K438DRAFT_1989296 [Mycena galopus ATCC 62051]
MASTHTKTLAPAQRRTTQSAAAPPIANVGHNEENQSARPVRSTRQRLAQLWRQITQNWNHQL